MKRLWRRFKGPGLALTLISVSFPAVWAQAAAIETEQAERARRLLESQVWSEKAWGASLAGQIRTEQMQTLLIQQLESQISLTAAVWNTGEGAFLNVLLDAAIQSGAAVPANVLEPYRETAAPFLILAARAENSAIVTPMMSSPDDSVWLAANNLLYGWRSEEWYQEVLADIAPSHQFRVLDAMNGAGWGAGSGGGTCGDGAFGAPKDFPPVALYSLVTEPQAGDVLLAKGLHKVYYRRTVATAERQTGFGSCASKVDRMGVRIGYLAGLSNRGDEDLGRLFHATTVMEFHGDAPGFVTAVSASLRTQAGDIAELLKKIRELTGLSGQGAPLRIKVKVEDARSDRSQALPAAPDAMDVP